MPKRRYYVVREDGEQQGPVGNLLTIIGSYRPMAAFMALIGFLVGVAITVALYAK